MPVTRFYKLHNNKDNVSETKALLSKKNSIGFWGTIFSHLLLVKMKGNNKTTYGHELVPRYLVQTSRYYLNDIT